MYEKAHQPQGQPTATQHLSKKTKDAGPIHPTQRGKALMCGHQPQLTQHDTVEAARIAAVAKACVNKLRATFSPVLQWPEPVGPSNESRRGLYAFSGKHEMWFI